MSVLELTQQILRECLQLEDTELDETTQIAGVLPEFNSLTITTIIASIEDELDCTVDDDELTIELFESVGSLAAFIASKM